MGALDDSYGEWLASHHGGDEDFGDDPTDPVADQPLWPQAIETDDRGPRPSGARPPKPVAHIRLDLELALAYRERYRQRPAGDRWVQMMRDDNEADIARLQAELTAATGDASPAGGETSTEAALIDDYQRTARVAYERGVPDDGGGPELPAVRPPGIPARASEPPRWPRSAAGRREPDLGL